MIRILSTKGLAVQIRDIIREARKRVVLISPFLDEDSDIYNYLHELRGKSYMVPIFVITRTPEQVLKSHKKSQCNAIKKLSEIPDCFVHYCHDLHTKCYFNESDMIITSLNILSTSEENNFELGVHIDIDTLDGKPFHDAQLRVNEICRAAVPIMNQIDSEGNFVRKPRRAFCINSGVEMDYKGLPNEDGTTQYIVRQVYRNLNVKQKDINAPQCYCHLCGRKYDETKKDNDKIFKVPPTLLHPFCEQCNEFAQAANLTQ